MKNPWIWAWFVAAALVVGFILGRGWSEDDSPKVAQQVPPAVGPEATPGAEPAAPAFSPSPPAPAAGPAAAPPPPPSAAESSDGSPNASTLPPRAGNDAFALPVDSGVVTAIDAGDVFNKQIARPSTADQPNQLGDAHRELEREPRNDGWAYTMEAELQNSMIDATSTGQFKVEHVECRTTICEVRVSGNGDQSDAVRNWSSALPSNNFNQQLYMNVSSTVSSHERVDAIYIFRRPRK